MRGIGELTPEKRRRIDSMSGVFVSIGSTLAPALGVIYIIAPMRAEAPVLLKSSLLPES